MLSVSSCVFFTGCHQTNRYRVEQKSKLAAKEVKFYEFSRMEYMSPDLAS